MQVNDLLDYQIVSKQSSLLWWVIIVFQAWRASFKRHIKLDSWISRQVMMGDGRIVGIFLVNNILPGVLKTFKEESNQFPRADLCPSFKNIWSTQVNSLFPGKLLNYWHKYVTCQFYIVHFTSTAFTHSLLMNCL